MGFFFLFLFCFLYFVFFMVLLHCETPEQCGYARKNLLVSSSTWRARRELANLWWPCIVILLPRVQNNKNQAIFKNTFKCNFFFFWTQSTWWLIGLTSFVPFWTSRISREGATTVMASFPCMLIVMNVSVTNYGKTAHLLLFCHANRKENECLFCKQVLSKLV